jgi:hypothetical protein
MIVASLALCVVLDGTAVAAKRYVITSPSQLKPSVRGGAQRSARS